MTISDLSDQILLCLLSTDKQLVWIAYNIEYLILNSGIYPADISLPWNNAT